MSKIRNYLGRNLRSRRKKDILSKKDRSVLMSGIRSKKTSFELKFFRELKNRGVEFKAHPKDIFGHPDLVITNSKTCVFLDSDFWHGWQYPRWKHKLKNDFWRQKIENNRRRDKLITRKLRTDGWRVVRLWEHDIKNLDGDFGSISEVR